MATVTVSALDSSHSPIESQELTRDDISSRIDSIKETFSRSVQESAERFQTKYGDAPWDSSDDITKAFESLTGVRSVTDIGPYDGKYMCPTVLLLVTDGMEDSVEQDVRSYYDGLHILESGDGSVVVGFDSGAYLFNRSPM